MVMAQSDWFLYYYVISYLWRIQNGGEVYRTNRVRNHYQNYKSGGVNNQDTNACILRVLYVSRPYPFILLLISIIDYKFMFACR